MKNCKFLLVRILFLICLVLNLNHCLATTSTGESKTSLGVIGVDSKDKEYKSFLLAPEGSYTLQGIVDDDRSEPFACSIGNYIVEIVKIENNKKYFILHGKGLLINSGWIHKNISTNTDIIYVVPKDSELKSGSKLSLYISGSEKNSDGSWNLNYYIKSRGFAY